MMHQEDQLKGEKERVQNKERAIEEMGRQREVMMNEHQEAMSAKKIEYDNLKRGFDEMHYEGENLRRGINQKQEEIAGLNRMINQQAHNQD
jgi:hypothetical protein